MNNSIDDYTTLEGALAGAKRMGESDEPSFGTKATRQIVSTLVGEIVRLSGKTPSPPYVTAAMIVSLDKSLMAWRGESPGGAEVAQWINALLATAPGTVPRESDMPLIGCVQHDCAECRERRKNVIDGERAEA